MELNSKLCLLQVRLVVSGLPASLWVTGLPKIFSGAVVALLMFHLSLWQNGVVSEVASDAGKCSCNQMWGFADYFMVFIKADNEKDTSLLFKMANSSHFWIDVFPLIMCHGFLGIINCLKNSHQVMHQVDSEARYPDAFLLKFIQYRCSKVKRSYPNALLFWGLVHCQVYKPLGILKARGRLSVPADLVHRCCVLVFL